MGRVQSHMLWIVEHCYVRNSIVRRESSPGASYDPSPTSILAHGCKAATKGTDTSRSTRESSHPGVLHALGEMPVS